MPEGPKVPEQVGKKSGTLTVWEKSYPWVTTQSSEQRKDNKWNISVRGMGDFTDVLPGPVKGLSDAKCILDTDGYLRIMDKSEQTRYKLSKFLPFLAR